MPTQTRTWQRRILTAARADGYADLYWYIEATAPGRQVFPAAWPGAHIPVVPVAPDPEISRHYAHLLAELFAANNPPAVAFAPALTAAESLRDTGCAWYVWGSLDVVCECCAGVGWESCCCTPVRRVA